jgi:hypothetical protein
MNPNSAFVTPRQPASAHRLSRVFVEIPPSPLFYKRSPHMPISSTSLKENARLQKPADLDLRTPSSLKRKFSMKGVVISSLKRAKILTSTNTIEKAVNVKMDNIVKTNSTEPKFRNSEDFPNGHSTCHQCGKKHDPSGLPLLFLKFVYLIE